MLSRLKARQEGEAVAMKSVRKHQLVLALELKRLRIERLVSERYYMFERTLVQSRLNRLIARQKELGIYRSGSPLEKSMNLRNKNQRAQQSFFLTSATLPSVKKGQQTLPQIPCHLKQVNIEMNSLQARIKQFNSFEKGAINKRSRYVFENVEKVPQVEQKKVAQANLGNVQNVEDSSHVVSNEGIRSSETQLQARSKTENENKTFPEHVRQSPSKVGLEQHSRRLPAIDNTRKDSNDKKTKINLHSSKTSETETENNGGRMEESQMTRSSAHKDSQVTSEGQEQLPQSQISRPDNKLEEINNAMDNLSVKSHQNLKLDQPKRPRTGLQGYDELSEVVKVHVTTNIRAQSAHWF